MGKTTEEFIKIIEQHKGIIYKITNLNCKNDSDRQDLYQEIVLQLWKSFENYNSQFKYSTWIYRIALNVAISFYRKENRRKEIANPISESLFNTAGINEDHDKNNDLFLLQKFVADLKELDKALMLLYLEEKSHKEIAEILGITETNVATKIGRIKKLLKQKFLEAEKE